MSPEKYDKAMHSSDSTFLEGLPAATDEAVGRLVTSIRETSSKPIVLVDVGCGTGTEEKRMAEAGVFDSIERVIGVDFNPLFIEEATRINTSDKVSYVCGDACELEKVLEPLGILSGEYHIIAASFDNTHGILPEDVMGKINRSMASIGHTIFIGFFDAGAFERGTKEFYGVNPQLCGTTEGADINLETSTIITVSGYRSKWRSSESATEMANKAGWELVDLWVADVGLFLWGRGKATPSSQDIKNLP